MGTTTSRKQLDGISHPCSVSGARAFHTNCIVVNDLLCLGLCCHDGVWTAGSWAAEEGAEGSYEGSNVGQRGVRSRDEVLGYLMDARGANLHAISPTLGIRLLLIAQLSKSSSSLPRGSPMPI